MGCSRRRAASSAAKMLRQAASCDFAVRVGELRLDPLDVPVAEISPEKLVDGLAGLVEAEIFEGFVCLRGDGGEARKNPAVGEIAFAL